MLLRRDIIILIIAIICGLLAFFIVANILKKSAQMKQRYVIAAKPLFAGQVIAEQDLSISEPIENANVADLFFQTQDAAGSEVVEGMNPGDLVMRSKVRKIKVEAAPVVAATPTPVPVVLPVPPGRRSFALAAHEVESISESIAPGNFVDVIGNSVDPNGDNEIRTITRSAQVLSVERNEEAKVKSITIALTATGSEMVSNSLTKGGVRLAMAPEGGAQEQGVVEIIRGVEKEQSARGGPQQQQQPPKK